MTVNWNVVPNPKTNFALFGYIIQFVTNVCRYLVVYQYTMNYLSLKYNAVQNVCTYTNNSSMSAVEITTIPASLTNLFDFQRENQSPSCTIKQLIYHLYSSSSV